jgi:hypothetical protein
VEEAPGYSHSQLSGFSENLGAVESLGFFLHSVGNFEPISRFWRAFFVMKNTCQGKGMRDIKGHGNSAARKDERHV